MMDAPIAMALGDIVAKQAGGVSHWFLLAGQRLEATYFNATITNAEV